MKFQQAEGIVAQLDENHGVLSHTAAGAYSYTAVAPTLGSGMPSWPRASHT